MCTHIMETNTFTIPLKMKIEMMQKLITSQQQLIEEQGKRMMEQQHQRKEMKRI